MFGATCFCCLSPQSSASATTDAAPLVEVEAGLFFRRGLNEDATAVNLDAIANIGFVMGRDCVAVIDAGGSLPDGQNLRRAIREITDLPIRYVVLSHVHPDHIFGAAAFKEDNPVFIGHARLPEQLMQRGEFYRQGLERILKAGAVDNPVSPTLLVRDRLEIELGGRILKLAAHPPAHTMCDLSVVDARSGILIAADLLFSGRVPVLDGDLKGWLAELAGLTASGVLRAVPGHGPALVDWREAEAAQRRYLTALLEGTRTAIARGVPIEEAANTVAQSERDKWQLFDSYHARNVISAYRRLEWE
ncbi:MAG: quinoprotein relay system zinc metallohydrolase 2 [Pseudomonadota bacterium]